MSTTAKIKPATAVFNESLVDDEVSSLLGFRMNFFLATVSFFLCKGHDLKATVHVKKVFVKSIKNVLTSHAVWHLTCCYSLLYPMTEIGNATENKQTDTSAGVSEVLLCSIIWFNSIPGVDTATKTPGGIRIKRRRRQHTV